MARAMIDSFTGAAADMPPNCRTPDLLVTSLRKWPRVSTWDMSEKPWLRIAIADLIKAGRIVEDKSEPYPWHRYKVLEKPSA